MNLHKWQGADVGSRGQGRPGWLDLKNCREENGGGRVRGAGRTQPHKVWSAIQGSGLYSKSWETTGRFKAGQ